MRKRRTVPSLLAMLIAAPALGAPVALRHDAPATSREVAAATTALGRRLHEALRRNGTAGAAKASYDQSALDGGEVLSLEWMLADCLRVQRDAFRSLLAEADRIPTLPEGFERRRAVLDLLDRMVDFRKANRRLGQLRDIGVAFGRHQFGRSGGATPELERFMESLDRALAEMDRRVGELKPLIEAAL